VIVLLLFPCLLISLFSLPLNHAVELKKQISCGLQLSNKSDEQVAFKVNKPSSKNVLEKKSLSEPCNCAKNVVYQELIDAVLGL
jgi:hypothetical protein